MTTHLGVLILFAACVAIVFGALLRDEAASQTRLAMQIFCSLVIGAWAVGWTMYLVTL